MRSCSISVYSLQMSNHARTHNYPLGDLPSGQDFLDLLRDYFKLLKSTIANDEEDQEILRTAVLFEDGRVLSGLLEGGGYGYASKLMNISNQLTTYKRQTNDAELLPYYFLAAIPEHQPLGLLAIQRSGPSGVIMPIERSLSLFLKNKCPQCKAVIERIVPGKAIAEYLSRGRISKIRFVKFDLPRDIADYIQGGYSEDAGTIEYQITPRKEVTTEFKEWVTKVISRKENIDSFVKIKSFKYNTVKVEILVGNKRRTIDLSDPDTVKADYDISKEVKTEDGIPIFESIDAIAREIAREIIDSMQLEVTGV